jgi:hypothetical protein
MEPESTILELWCGKGVVAVALPESSGPPVISLDMGQGLEY